MLTNKHSIATYLIPSEKKYLSIIVDFLQIRSEGFMKFFTFCYAQVQIRSAEMLKTRD